MRPVLCQGQCSADYGPHAKLLHGGVIVWMGLKTLFTGKSGRANDTGDTIQWICTQLQPCAATRNGPLHAVHGLWQATGVRVVTPSISTPLTAPSAMACRDRCKVCNSAHKPCLLQHACPCIQGQLLPAPQNFPLAKQTSTLITAGDML